MAAVLVIRLCSGRHHQSFESKDPFLWSFCNYGTPFRWSDCCRWEELPSRVLFLLQGIIYDRLILNMSVTPPPVTLLIAIAFSDN